MEAQSPITRTNQASYFSSWTSFSECGTNKWTVSAIQAANQNAMQEFKYNGNNIKNNGWSIGSGLNWEQWSSWRLRVNSRSGSNRRVYFLFNTSTKTVTRSFSAYTCSAAPTVSTSAASAITCNSATLGGNVTDEGTASLTARGFIYGTVEADVNNSTIASLTGSSTEATASGTSEGAYTKPISSLSSGVTYYAKAYATNSVGTSYGSTVSFDANFTVASASSGITRLGAGTADITATTSTGADYIKWYDAPTGGNHVKSEVSGSTWTTGSLSSTTTYYAEAYSSSCTSPSRTAVTITVNYPPGGVSSNLLFWLKADAQAYNDAGYTLATDGQEVQEWHDLSGNSYNATDNGATGPDWDQDGVNFNPALDFNDANSENLEVATGIFGTETKNDIFVYMVLADDEDRTDNIFYESLDDGKKFSSHCAWSNESVYWDYGNATDNTGGRIMANWGTDYGVTNLWAFGSSTSASTPHGTKKYIKRNNTIHLLIVAIPQQTTTEQVKIVYFSLVPVIIQII